MGIDQLAIPHASYSRQPNPFDGLIRLAIGLMLLFVVIATASAQTNYRTNVTVASLLSAGGPLSYGTICATPADIYGNPITVSATTWGLIANNSQPMCGTVTNGVLSGLTVPDAAHTNASGPIYYNFAIQADSAPGVPIPGQMTLIVAVPNVTGPTFPLDAYTPVTNTPVPASPVIVGGTAVPSACTGTSLYLPNNAAQVYTCNNGVYALTGGVGSATIQGAWAAGTNYQLNAIVSYVSGSGTPTYWVSQQNANVGVTPGTNTAFWVSLTGPAGASGQAAGAAYTSGVVTPASGQNGDGLPDLIIASTVPAHPGADDTVIGYGAGSSLNGASDQYGGQLDVILGTNAAHNATTMRESVVIGYEAAYSLTGNGLNTPDDNINVVIGSAALASATDSEASVIIGQKAGTNIGTSAGDVVIGVHGGTGVTGASAGNVLVGQNVLNGCTTACVSTSNTLIGHNVGYEAAGGTMNKNIGIGDSAFAIIGNGASDNTAIGYSAGSTISTGTYNIFLGPEELSGSPAITGHNNIKIGWNGTHFLTSGYYNTLFNADSNQISSGYDNVAIGTVTGPSITTGYYNVVMGVGAGQNMGGNDQNDVFIGQGAGLANTGNQNTFVGPSAGNSANSGSGNVALGYNSQLGSTVSNAVQIGAGTNSTANSLQFGSVQIVDGNGDQHVGTSSPADTTTCTVGAIRADVSYIYVCTAANIWKRAALSSF